MTSAAAYSSKADAVTESGTESRQSSAFAAGQKSSTAHAAAPKAAKRTLFAPRTDEIRATAPENASGVTTEAAAPAALTPGAVEASAENAVIAYMQTAKEKNATGGASRKKALRQTEYTAAAIQSSTSAAEKTAPTVSREEMNIAPSRSVTEPMQSEAKSTPPKPDRILNEAAQAQTETTAASPAKQPPPSSSEVQTADTGTRA